MMQVRALLLTLAVALPAAFGSAGASTLTVTSLGDSASVAGDGTLRGELLASVAGDTIVFTPGLSGPINLTATLPIGHTVAIQGPGPGIITLDGGGSVEVIAVISGTLTLSGVTIAHGGGTANGGGVAVDSNTSMIVSNTAFIGNHANIGGGAIDSSGAANLTIDSSTFTDNSAGNGAGGAIANGATAKVTRSTFIGNTAVGDGGAIDNDQFGQMTLEDDTFVDNVSNLFGGAVSNLGPLSIVNSTFSANQAMRGAGVASGSSATTIENDIFADNAATTGPSATFPNNFGPVSHNVFFGNTAGGVEDDQSGYGFPDFVLAAAEPLLPLANNGGPTLTQLPVANGAAICAGSVALVPGDLTTDQRGLARTVMRNGTACVDAGAVQTPGTIPALTMPALALFGGLLALLGLRRRRVSA